MMLRHWVFAAVFFSLACGLAGLSGCTRSSAPASDGLPLATAQQGAMEVARQQMDMIPLPSKARYMGVKRLSAWENPYVTVQGRMVTLHVMMADANTTDLGVGGMLRPVGARREDLNVRVNELASALSAVPGTSWPYGRVVAVEEAHKVPASAEPEVRRNMETVMKTLNDMGVVVYEWNEAAVEK